MTLPEKPSSMVIIGAGAIGVEFASFYAALGTEVTIIEYLPNLVPNEDQDISEELERAFNKRKIKFYTGCAVTGAKVGDNGVTVTADPNAGGDPISVTADVVLMAIGVIGNVENIGLENIGVTVERGFIRTNDRFETGVRRVWAIGDVVAGTPALAHTASAEAVYVAERIAGQNPQPVPYDANPACTYCHPEIASVGLTEKAANDQQIPIKVGKFPFGPLGKTVAAGEYPGLVKFIWHANTHELIGAHMIGPAVTDLIAVPTLAKSTEVNAESFIHTIFAHPTFSEALKEAAEDALGHAIHI